MKSLRGRCKFFPRKFFVLEVLNPFLENLGPLFKKYLGED